MSLLRTEFLLRVQGILLNSGKPNKATAGQNTVVSLFAEIIILKENIILFGRIQLKGQGFYHRSYTCIKGKRLQI